MGAATALRVAVTAAAVTARMGGVRKTAAEPTRAPNWVAPEPRSRAPTRRRRAQSEKHVCYSQPQDFALDGIQGGFWDVHATSAEFVETGPNASEWRAAARVHPRDARARRRWCAWASEQKSWRIFERSGGCRAGARGASIAWPRTGPASCLAICDVRWRSTSTPAARGSRRATRSTITSRRTSGETAAIGDGAFADGGGRS